MTEDKENRVKALTKSIDEGLEELSKLTTDAAKSEEFLAFLKLADSFYHYSFGNLMLILFQRPEASYVAGFRDWQRRNRCVKRGEKGIAILAPCFYPDKKDPDKSRIFFKTVYVFDVTQTEGEPLPDEIDWKSPENNQILNERLEVFAQDRGIQMDVTDLMGPQGVSMGGQIKIDITAGSETRVHELAHEILNHHNSGIEKDIKELEAESVGWIVCHHFGLNASGAPNYLAMYHAKPEEIKAQRDRILKAAREIIEFCEGEDENATRQSMPVAA